MVDMYRAVIEHPEFMPTELKNRPDLTLGKERGRIWRIRPDNDAVLRGRPNLGKATSAELVKSLADPNAWRRLTAQRLLVERQDKSVAADVRKLATGDRPLGRLHALWTLQGLKSLTEADVATALRLMVGGDQEVSKFIDPTAGPLPQIPGTGVIWKISRTGARGR